MKKKYGVCLGMLAMGLVVIGAPASRAQSRMAAGEAGSSESSAASTSATPAASSPADLDRRIEALETELLELRTELTAKKDAEAAEPAVTPAVAAQDKPAEKTTVASLLGPTSVSGFVDGYYQVNFNHPAGNTTALRSFEFRDKSINLNLAELILDKAPSADSSASRIGYHVSLGYGDAMDAYLVSEPSFSLTQRLLKEAYGSWLAPVGKGLQIDFGKFVTPMGAEVVEAKDNWNYSRSILFGYAIPFYHFGLRAKYTISDKYAVTGFLVNGWNNVVDNNSGKTYGMSFAWTPTKTITVTPTYLAGPEQTTGRYGSTLNVNNVWRQTWDLVAMYSPAAGSLSKFAFMGNFDYGRGDRTTPVLTVPPVYWWGLAGYVKYNIGPNDYVAGRYEYFDDRYGTQTGTPFIHYNEVTATYQHTLSSYLLTRFEYRHDMSNKPYFPLSTFIAPIKYQNTATISLIFLFDSRNAK